jgi:hypothetical protein
LNEDIDGMGINGTSAIVEGFKVAYPELIDVPNFLQRMRIYQLQFELHGLARKKNTHEYFERSLNFWLYGNSLEQWAL